MIINIHMQRLTCTLTLYMNVCNFLRSLPSLVCRDCDMVCMCVYHCCTGDCKSTIFYARNSPAWTKYSNGKKQNLEKHPEKKLAYACSNITDLYGNLQCFVLPRPFSGGGNRVARLYIHTHVLMYIYI